MTIEEKNIVPKDRSLVRQSQPVRRVEKFYSNPLLQRMANDLLDRHENYGDGVEEGGNYSRGTKEYENGDLYKGELKDGEPHGQGTYTFEGGTVYEGQWKNGVEHGYGKIIYDDGEE